MKPCSHCGAVKPLDAFSPNRHHADGRQSWCRDCHAARRRAKYQRDPSDDRRYNKAYGRALRALADRHRREFDALLDEHLRDAS